jgi:hypothetical protein
VQVGLKATVRKDLMLNTAYTWGCLTVLGKAAGNAPQTRD